MMILAKSGILILFIFVVLLFDCKGTFFLTKIQDFHCFLDDDKQKTSKSWQNTWWYGNKNISLQIEEMYNVKNQEIMAIEFKTIPVLHGEAAARFVEAADEALEKRGSIDFSKQVAKARAILKRSKMYV